MARLRMRGTLTRVRVMTRTRVTCSLRLSLRLPSASHPYPQSRHGAIADESAHPLPCLASPSARPISQAPTDLLVCHRGHASVVYHIIHYTLRMQRPFRVVSSPPHPGVMCVPAHEDSRHGDCARVRTRSRVCIKPPARAVARITGYASMIIAAPYRHTVLVFIVYPRLRHGANTGTVHCSERLSDVLVNALYPRTRVFWDVNVECQAIKEFNSKDAPGRVLRVCYPQLRHGAIAGKSTRVQRVRAVWTGLSAPLPFPLPNPTVNLARITMVGTYDLQQFALAQCAFTINHADLTDNTRKAAFGRVHNMYIFTDLPPQPSEWTAKQLKALNRLLRSLLNSAVSWDAFQYIVQHHILTDPWLMSLKQSNQYDQFPLVLATCFKWQYRTAEGNFPNTMEEYFMWRRIPYVTLEEDSSRETRSASLALFLKQWWIRKSRKVPYTQKLQAMAQETVHRKLASSLQSTLFKFTGARHTMLTALLSTEHLPTSLRTLREAWKSTTKVVHTTEYAHNLRDDMHRQPSAPTWCTVAGPCLSRKKSTPGTGIHNSEACASGAWRPGRVFVHGKCSAPEFSLTPHAPMVHGGGPCLSRRKSTPGTCIFIHTACASGARRRGHVRCALQRLSWALLLMDHAPMVHGGGGTSVRHYTEHQGLPLSMRQWCTATRPSPHVVQTGRFCSLCIPQWCTTAGCTTAGCTTAEHALAHIGCLCPLRRTVARCAPVVHGSGPDPLRSGSAHTAFPRPVCTIGAQPSAMCPQLAEAVSGPPANGACAGGALRRRHVFPLLYWTPGHSLSMRQWCTATWPCPHAVQSVRVCSLGMHQWCTTAEHAPPASVVYGAPWPGVRQWCTAGRPCALAVDVPAVCASGARQWAEPVALWLGIH
ncbi:uncharacterized protein B0H18DRAFT_956772 [Fomitopsis serialis]|uniref:uncharacterized protein n=1 Tax=Fomitopsis serialis TaxID=139415 RepID=UPI0020080BDF|nr:uncharacterized protein B0H18DRAFT_956772 [Neoantrodia serialis]KAH9921001.1 hypothetical protein B0H18DRAFT_956772 [Neoantrodia serialis]